MVLAPTAVATVHKAAIYSDRDNRPHAMPVNRDGIPDEMKVAARWLCWRFDWREGKDGGKWSKIPLNPRTLAFAKSNDPATWGTLTEAWAVYGAGDVDGVGFVLGDLMGVDIDDCRDPATGVLTAEAQTVVERFRTYAEVSPSGTGVKLIGRGQFPAAWTNRPGAIELYTGARYFALTGVKP